MDELSVLHQRKAPAEVRDLDRIEVGVAGARAVQPIILAANVRAYEHVVKHAEHWQSVADRVTDACIHQHRLRLDPKIAKKRKKEKKEKKAEAAAAGIETPKSEKKKKEKKEKKDK